MPAWSLQKRFLQWSTGLHSLSALPTLGLDFKDGKCSGAEWKKKCNTLKDEKPWTHSKYTIIHQLLFKRSLNISNKNWNIFWDIHKMQPQTDGSEKYGKKNIVVTFKYLIWKDLLLTYDILCYIINIY